MSGYTYRAKAPAPQAPPVRGIRLLTREEFQAMSEPAKAARRAHWQGIIRGLQHEHERRYHNHATELAAAIQCDNPHCTALALSGTGLCAQHLSKARRAA